MHAQPGQCRSQFRRMDRICAQRPTLIERARSAVIMVGDHRAVDWLGGMARPPTDDYAAEAILVENVPQGFRFSREVRDRLHAAAIRGWLGEAVDAVLEWPLSGGDGSPQHRGERWMQGSYLAGGAVFDEALDIGHLARIHEWMDDFPIGRIPSDQEKFTFRHSLRGRNEFLDDKNKVLLRPLSGDFRIEEIQPFGIFDSGLTVWIGRLQRVCFDELARRRNEAKDADGMHGRASRKPAGLYKAGDFLRFRHFHRWSSRFHFGGGDEEAGIDGGDVRQALDMDLRYGFAGFSYDHFAGQHVPVELWTVRIVVRKVASGYLRMHLKQPGSGIDTLLGFIPASRGRGDRGFSCAG